MPGPPPNPNARRRNRRPGVRRLPAAGRQGEPPPYPLSRASKSVLAIWDELWHSPQAAAWEEYGWVRLVARYARLLVTAERASATAALLREVRQLEDRLGLSPMAMQRLRWEIVEDGERPEAEPASVTNLDDYRDLYGA